MSIFNKIQLKRPKTSIFDLSYDHKLSMKMGYLVPVHTQECVPGDHITMSSEAMLRMMPMISPIMHKVDVYMHFFFVPNRILWKNWEKFITGGEDPNSVQPLFPTMGFHNAQSSQPPSSLTDYLGLPVNVDFGDAQQPISALPFAGYYKIWHEYYRDQNLIQSNDIELVDGVQPQIIDDELLKLRKRAWEHDYFTSCLPFAQKGAAVTLPVSFTNPLPVEVNFQGAQNPLFTDITGNPINNEHIATLPSGEVIGASTGTNAFYDPSGSLEADPTGLSTNTTINDLRTAFSLQKWLEKNARAGTRYIESILNHFGVSSSDKRLQRPEYLGGSKASMAISEVLQTSESAATPQGGMAGHGISVSDGKNFSYYCEEHGYIHGLISIRPKTAYYQGVPAHFSKTQDRMQYYWPDFAHLGEQAVLNKELFLQDSNFNPADNVKTFGYIPRYSEYRFNSSRVSGEMKTSLEFWHMARKFAAPPSLNQLFVEADPTKRIFAVVSPSDDEIVAHIYHKIIAKRPIPLYGNPGGI